MAIRSARLPLDSDPNYLEREGEREAKNCSCFKCFYTSDKSKKIYDRKISDRAYRLIDDKTDIIDHIGVPLLDKEQKEPVESILNPINGIANNSERETVTDSVTEGFEAEDQATKVDTIGVDEAYLKQRGEALSLFISSNWM